MVVDASVLAAWVFRERNAQDAHGLIQGQDLHAPRLLAYELANIARTKSLRDPQKAADIEASLADAMAMDIHWHEVDHVAVLRLAMATGLSTYDASYLWLARTLAVPLVTFDERLRTAR